MKTEESKNDKKKTRKNKFLKIITVNLQEKFMVNINYSQLFTWQCGSNKYKLDNSYPQAIHTSVGKSKNAELYEKTKH